MSLSYCGEMVRKHDPDRFLLSLFVPADRREALWALYAFNHEIAKTREVVTETQLGLIRLQWWRDALAAYYDRGAITVHQVMQPLAAAIKAHNLPRELFDNLIYAREFDLEDRMPANLQGLVHYADFTGTPLLALSLMILGEGAEAASEKAREAAIAYGLAGIIRALPFHFRQRRNYLPEDKITATGIEPHLFFEGQHLELLPPVIYALAEEAEKHLKAAATAPRFIRRMNKLTRLYLAHIRAAGNDAFSPAMQKPVFLKELRLLWA